LDPWGAEATTWRDHLAQHLEDATDLPDAAKKKMEEAATDKAVTADVPEDKTPSPLSQEGTAHLTSKFGSMQERAKAAGQSPYDIASKISPLKFDIVAPPERKSPREDEVADAISGRRERRFTKMMTSMEGGDLKKGDEVGEEEQTDSEEEKLMQETKGAAYMRAEDEEERRLRMQKLEKEARDHAVDNAITIKAEAIAEEKQTAATKAVEDIKAAVAKRNEAKSSEEAAEASAGKGWLTPKLGAELVLEQKDEVEKDDMAVRKARENELGIKQEAKMSAKEKKLHHKKHKESLAGSKAAAAANDKELAMKFVHSEFERRKKVAYKQKLRDVQLNDKMRQTAETMAKNDAAKENTAKAKESMQKGKSVEARNKRDEKENQQKLVDAANKPKPQNCKVAPWKAWSPCSRPCSGGMATRSRVVLTAKGGAGADCPPLAESKPCNTQPCMTVTFSKDYCDKALKKCTESREMYKGCKVNPSRKFGNGAGMQTGMMNEQNKVDRMVKGMNKDDDADDDENEPEGDDSDSSLVESPVKKLSIGKTAPHSVPKAAAPQSMHEKAATPLPSADPVAVAPPGKGGKGGKGQPPLGVAPRESGGKGGKGRQGGKGQPAMAMQQPAMRPQPPVRQHARLGQAAPSIQYRFHNGGRGDAMIMKAVAAAEHSISSKEGAAATNYEFDVNSSPRSVIGDLGESFIQTSVGTEPPAGTQQNAPLEAQQAADKQIRKLTDPEGAQKAADAADEADKDSDKAVSDAANEQCAKFKDDVAEYCGQMVDCVTKSLDTQDVNYSKQLTKDVQKAAKGTGLEDGDQEAKDKIDAQEEEREAENKEANESIPRTSNELTSDEDTEIQKIKKMSTPHFDDSKFLHTMPQLIPTFSKPEAASEMKPATRAWIASSKVLSRGQEKEESDHSNAAGPEMVKGAGLFPH